MAKLYQSKYRDRFFNCGTDFKIDLYQGYVDRTFIDIGEILLLIKNLTVLDRFDYNESVIGS